MFATYIYKYITLFPTQNANGEDCTFSMSDMIWLHLNAALGSCIFYFSQRQSIFTDLTPKHFALIC